MLSNLSKDARPTTNYGNASEIDQTIHKVGKEMQNSMSYNTKEEKILE